MRITAWISIAIALSVLAGQAATADPEARNHGINKRQESQKNRVQQRKEAIELTQRRRDIEQLEKSYKSDGVLRTKERTDLHRQLNQAGDEIRQEKHDQQQRS
jgi:hypothetical protein